MVQTRPCFTVQRPYVDVLRAQIVTILCEVHLRNHAMRFGDAMARY
jgi:hypothetical protein